MTATPASAPRAGDVLELAVGEVVHGGWCVSRADDTGWVVFVRHALPGERVLATVTQVTARFARADATRVLQAAPDRVAAPCRYARPGGCGGCDWQHATPDAQRRLKAEVIRQQLRRIAGIDRDVEVQPLAGNAAGLGWRTVVSFAVDRAGSAGLHRHRSHEVVEIDRCLIAHDLVSELDVTGRTWPGARAVEVAVAPSTGGRGVLVDGPGRLAAGLPRPAWLTQRAAGRDWRVSLGGFWQVHPAAADTLAGDVLTALRPGPGEFALDLYAGVGLFAGVLARAVGPQGQVVAVEQDAAAVRDARHNLRDWPRARVHRGDVAAVLRRESLEGASIAVLDPPRTGASRAVVDALAGMGELRAIAYVSCDPATLARDLRLLVDSGFELTSLRGYDAFPMTHHVECLAVLERLKR